MNPKVQERIRKAEDRLREIRTEQQRQMGFAGLRLGVFQRLRELGAVARRVLKRIETLSNPDRRTEAQV